MSIQIEFNIEDNTLNVKQKKEKKKSKRQIFQETVTAQGYEAYTIVDKEVVWSKEYRFPDEESSYRPRCINKNCINPVAVSKGTIYLSKGREIRSVCSQCHLASYKKKPLKPGVIAHKKTKCENEDGHLGFNCSSIIHYPGVLELDHIDGNHNNNIPENLQTLCVVCHKYKSFINGDCR